MLAKLFSIDDFYAFYTTRPFLIWFNLYSGEWTWRKVYCHIYCPKKGSCDACNNGAEKGFCCQKDNKYDYCPESAVEYIPDDINPFTCVNRKQGNKTRDPITIHHNLESCKLEIWSGDNFTGNRAECTGNCDIDKLGSVGNDKARSARCSCNRSRELILVKYLANRV